MSSFSSLKDIRQLVREADNLQRLGTIRLCSHYYYVSTDSLVQAKIFIAAAKLKCSDVARLRVKGVNNVFLKRFGISKLYGDLDYVGRVAWGRFTMFFCLLFKISPRLLQLLRENAATPVLLRSSRKMFCGPWIFHLTFHGD